MALPIVRVRRGEKKDFRIVRVSNALPCVVVSGSIKPSEPVSQVCSGLKISRLVPNAETSQGPTSADVTSSCDATVRSWRTNKNIPRTGCVRSDMLMLVPNNSPKTLSDAPPGSSMGRLCQQLEMHYIRWLEESKQKTEPEFACGLL